MGSQTNTPAQTRTQHPAIKYIFIQSKLVSSVVTGEVELKSHFFVLCVFFSPFLYVFCQYGSRSYISLNTLLLRGAVKHVFSNKLYIDKCHCVDLLLYYYC